MGRATGKNNPNLGALELLKGLYQTVGGAGRGALSATLGLPGDLESLARMLIPRVSEKTTLPTTEDVSNFLPKVSDKPNTMEELGRWMPATPGQAAKLAKPMLRTMAKGIDEGMQGRGILKGALSQMAPMYVVKPRGGNWLPGQYGVDEALKGEMRGRFLNDPNMPNIDDTARANALAMDDWVNGPLRKYMMRDMASPEDPIRKLADEGILHVDPARLNINMTTYGNPNFMEPHQKLMAKSDAAKHWEGASDRSVGATPRWMLAPEDSSIHLSKENPWLMKLPEDTHVYNLEDPGNVMEDLGLDQLSNHVYDRLIDGTLTPEQLKSGNFSVEAAVRSADRERKAAQAAQEAEELKRLRNEAVVEHAPVKDGYGWVEFKPQDGDAWEAANSHLTPAEYDRQVAQFRRDRMNKLREALNAEGEAMGHCVGGEDYCRGVAEGRTRLFSLRDASGKPVVTVEAAPGMKSITEAEQAFYDDHGRLPRDMAELGEWGMKNDIPISAEDFNQGDAKWRILQIKGSGKKDSVQRITPEDLQKVQPHLQEFLNSGDWGEVKDLSNAGLRDMKDLYGDKLPQGTPRFMTYEQQQQFNAQYPDLKSRMSDAIDDGDWEVEFANGGMVDPPGYFENLDEFLAR